MSTLIVFSVDTKSYFAISVIAFFIEYSRVFIVSIELINRSAHH